MTYLTLDNILNTLSHKEKVCPKLPTVALYMQFFSLKKVGKVLKFLVSDLE